MKKLLIMVFGLMLILSISSGIIAEEKKDVELEFGGRLQNDWVFFTSSDEVFGDLYDGVEFRRARFFAEGTFYGHVQFKVQYDFAGGDADFKDVYIALVDLPFNLKVGHFKEPFSIEEQTSSKYLQFLELSLINVFSPSRNDGIMVYGNMVDKKMTIAAGLFRDADDYGVAEGIEPHYNFTGRLTFTPLYENKGKQLLHLGVAFSARDLGVDDFRYRQRPEIHQAGRYVDTGSFAADKETLLGAEAAIILGRFSVQAEYMNASMDAPEVNDPSFGGFYITASVFLTDDYRTYKQADAAFDRIKPSANLFDEGGIGAIELLARYSHLDLTDADIEGGEEDNFTVGLNWYLNPYTRVMLNYVSADVKDVGKIGALMMRFQIDFKMK